MFVGALQYIGSEGGNIQATSSARAADFGLDPWGSRQHHWTGPTQPAGQMGMCSGQSDGEEGENLLTLLC